MHTYKYIPGVSWWSFQVAAVVRRLQIASAVSRSCHMYRRWSDSKAPLPWDALFTMHQVHVTGSMYFFLPKYWCTRTSIHIPSILVVVRRYCCCCLIKLFQTRRRRFQPMGWLIRYSNLVWHVILHSVRSSALRRGLRHTLSSAFLFVRASIPRLFRLWCGVHEFYVILVLYVHGSSSR